MLGTGIKHRKSFIYFLVLLIVLGTMPVNFANGNGAGGNSGNDNTLDLPECAEKIEKIEVGGGYEVGDVITGSSIVITVTDVKDGGEIMEISWEADEDVSFVYMKAGNGGNLITVDPADDEGDAAVDGKNALSHVTFYRCNKPEPEDDPSFVIKKSVDDDEPLIGQEITYSYELENTGNVPLDNLSALDDRLGNVTLDKTSLDPGEIATGSLMYTVDQDDLTLSDKNAAFFDIYINIVDGEAYWDDEKLVDQDDEEILVPFEKPLLPRLQ